MPREVKRNSNKEAELSQFDNMSLDDINKPVPKTTANISAQQQERRRKKVSTSAEATNMFRPVTAVDKKAEFKADKKPELPTSTPKIRKGPKWLMPAILAGVAVVTTLIFVTGANKTILYAVKGIDTYYKKYEDNTVTSSSATLVDLAKNFSRLSTDSGAEGEAAIYIREAGADTFLKHDLAGEYKLKYSLERGKGVDSLKFDYTLDGVSMGTVELFQDSQNNETFIKPSFLEQAIKVPYDKKIFASVAFPEYWETYLLDIYSGADTPALFQNLAKADDMTKMLKAYGDILKNAEADYKYTKTDQRYNSDMVITRTATWAQYRPTLDALVQQAKSDGNLQELVTSAGIKSEAYLNMLNTATSRISALYSENPDVKITEVIYIKNEQIIGRSLTLPSDDELKSLTLEYVFLDTGFHFNLTNDSVTTLDINLEFAKTDGKYTGKGKITTDTSQYSLTYQDLSFGDVQTGTLQITENNGFTYNLGFNNEKTDITISKGETQLIGVSITNTTKTISSAPRAPSNVFDFDRYEEEKLTALVATANTEKMRQYIEEIKDVVVDPELLNENILAYLKLFAPDSTGYTLPYSIADMEYVEVDISEQVQAELDRANKQAENLAFAMTQFIAECKANEKNEYPIANGVYTGYVEEKDGNLQYQAEFAEKNMRECIGVSVDPGYYCVLVKDEKVLYAYWSETEDFAVRVAERNLPSHFTGIETLEEIKGSYPTISTRS